MGNELSRLFVVIGAKTIDFEKGIAKAKLSMQQLGIAMTAVGAVITGTMVAITVKWANAGEEVWELAQKTGFTTEALSELRYAANLSGSSISSLEVGIKRMQVAITNAKDETSASAKTLKQLGLSYKELAELKPEQQFEAITTALADVVDPAEKAALAIELFGRSGTDMLPLLAEGSQGLADMKKEAHDLGVVFDTEAAKKADAFKDSITKLKTALAGIGGQIATVLAPILTKFLTMITNVIKGITDWTQKHPALTRAITTVAFAIGVLMLAVGSFITVCIVIQRIAPAVGAAFHTMLGPIGLITGAISLLVIGITALISHFGAQGRAMGELKGKVKELGDTLISALGAATRQAIIDATTMANAQKEAIQSVIDYIKGIQTEGMELISEEALAKIREIRPDLAADLETIQNGIKDTHAAYDLLTDDITKARVAQIKIELDKPTLTEAQKRIYELTKTPEQIRVIGLTSEEKAALLSEMGTLLSGEAKRLIEKNAPDLVSILGQQQTDIDTALTTQITSWKTHWKDISDGWDGSLAYLRDTIIPEMNLAIENDLLPPELVDEMQKRMDEILAGAEKAKKPATTPWWAYLHPLLGLISSIMEIKQGFGNITAPNIPLKDAGGLIEGPGLFAVGPGVKEIAREPLAQSSIYEVNLHFGTFIADDISLQRFAEKLDQVLKRIGRRNSFGQVQQGYFSGTSSI